MIRSLIGAAVGSKLAKRYPAAGGVAGIAATRVVPFMLKRISFPAMLAMGAGGYMAKRYFGDKDEGSGGTAGSPKDTGSVIDPPPGGATKG